MLLAVMEICLLTSLSNVAKLAAHPKFVWVFNANYDGTIFYNDLYVMIMKVCPHDLEALKRYSDATHPRILQYASASCKRSLS
jgi:hypothetical protein